MGRKSVLDVDRFIFKLYKRNLPKGELFYARFYERGSSVVLADRSTGEADERRATAAAGKLLAKLPLAKLARAKAPKAVAARNRSREATVLQAAASCEARWTSLIRPVSTSKIKPRTGTSLAIHGCDLTIFICSRVFCSGSL